LEFILSCIASRVSNIVYWKLMRCILFYCTTVSNALLQLRLHLCCCMHTPCVESCTLYPIIQFCGYSFVNETFCMLRRMIMTQWLVMLGFPSLLDEWCHNSPKDGAAILKAGEQVHEENEWNRVWEVYEMYSVYVWVVYFCNCLDWHTVPPTQLVTWRS